MLIGIPLSIFARVCIDVEVGGQLFDHLPIRTATGLIHKQRCIYEWLPPNCKNCKVFGHNTSSCKGGKEFDPKVEKKKGNETVNDVFQQQEQNEEDSLAGSADTDGIIPECSESARKKSLRPDTPRISPTNSVASITHLTPINELGDGEKDCHSNDLVQVLSSALAEKGTRSKGPRNKAKQKQGVKGKTLGKPPDSLFV
ncbi:hypothetical protein LIER_38886 [Lithospermum erythrorhizon]|uniref:Uncharacterized protein n=1 Tax=Lithospermum erythrorhizon TaxID=34254 RepID=A0AAV3Q616_LITER